LAEYFQNHYLVKFQQFKIHEICCFSPQIKISHSVGNYLSTLRNITEESNILSLLKLVCFLKKLSIVEIL